MNSGHQAHDAKISGTDDRIGDRGGLLSDEVNPSARQARGSRLERGANPTFADKKKFHFNFGGKRCNRVYQRLEALETTDIAGKYDSEDVSPIQADTFNFPWQARRGRPIVVRKGEIVSNVDARAVGRGRTV